MPASPTVLHYVGYDNARGGIVSVVRALAETQKFTCILGVNTGYVQRREPQLPALELPQLEGEVIGWSNLWRARVVAREVQSWLQDDPSRVFHGHSRAGLLVALWLVRWGEKRVVASVHCYGKQRWFYRWAMGRLGEQLYWLTPAMRNYYGVMGESWSQCIPSCVPERSAQVTVSREMPRGRLRLGGIGMLVEWKGWHLVLDALEILPAIVKDQMQFSHIGSADSVVASQKYAEMLRERSAAFGGKVAWLGQQDTSEAFLREIDVLVLPSINEPFSLAMIEALLAGVPVLRADSGGAVDVIKPGVNGWLFRSGDACDLARALKTLLEADALSQVRIDREELRRFSAPVVAAQWAEVYARL